jgi:predicted flap endonuclease-1-like 5' DNA nuclease
MLYVAGEIIVWMVLAFALGLLIGWFVWGLRQRKTAPAVAPTARPAPPSDVESVTVRPVPKAAPVASAPEEALPVTPPAGQPAVPLAPPLAPAAAAETDLDDQGPAVRIIAPAEQTAPIAPDEAAAASEPLDAADPTVASPPAYAPEPSATGDAEPATGIGEPPLPAPESAGNEELASLVADEPAWRDDMATPAHGQPVTALSGDPVETAATAAAAPTTTAASPAAPPPDTSGAASALGRPVAPDDLKAIRGVDERIEVILRESGIVTWRDLAGASPERLRTLLDLAGDQFRVHDPGSWPEQAGLAADGRWHELALLQASL